MKQGATQEVWTAAEYQNFLKTKQKTAKGNKYGAVRAEWNGRKFDSTAERDYAVQLDLLKQAGQIKRVTYQHKLRLEANGVFVCDYLVDFRTVMPNGTIELHEVKGVETDLWRNKWELTKAQLQELEPGAILKLVKKVGGVFEVVETFRASDEK